MYIRRYDTASIIGEIDETNCVKDLRNFNLYRAYLVGLNLRECIFTGANLREADLRECDLSECIFESANLVRALLDRSDCHKACFKNACVAGASFIQANLEYADMGGAIAFGACFTDANLRDADFRIDGIQYLREDDSLRVPVLRFQYNAGTQLPFSAKMYLKGRDTNDKNSPY
jgi:hypothetical protein